MTIIQCGACKDEHHEDNMRWGSVLGNYLCENCFADDLDTAGNIRIINTDGTMENILVGDYNIINEYGDDWTDMTVTREWVSTNGGRGYHDTNIEGLVSVLTGWTTGFHDDVIGRRKKVFNDFVGEMLEGHVLPPCKIAIITDSTSNVFSTAVSVQVRPEDEKLFNEWLDSSDNTSEDLSYSLS